MPANFINAKKALQVLTIRERLWDEGFTRSDFLVLLTIAESVAVETKKGSSTVKDTCFPSLPSIAKSAGVSVRQVQDSIDKLVDGGYLRTMDLPWRERRGRKSNNHFSGIRFWITEKWDAIETPLDKRKGDQAEVQADAPTPTAEDMAGVEALVEQATPSAPTFASSDMDDLFVYLGDTFPDHPTMKGANARRMMHRPMRLLLEKSLGSVWLCEDFFGFLTPELQKLLRGSQKLAPYLTKVVQIIGTGIGRDGSRSSARVSRRNCTRRGMSLTCGGKTRECGELTQRGLNMS